MSTCFSYSQVTGVGPSWYSATDGGQCGCLPVLPCVAPLHRRFSPYCRLTEVTAAAPQVYFRVAPSVVRDGQTLTFNHSQVKMEVYRKGVECVPITSYNAWRRDANGWIGFYFDDTLFSQPVGYYIGDIYIDCCYCFSVNLRLPRCQAVVTDCYSLAAMETCGTGDCTVVETPGVGSVGGFTCTPSPTDCGGVAPYFPIENPQVAPPPVCSPDPGCALQPPCPASTVG